MNIEAYSYSVLTSILGIIVVFVSLVGLSALMVLLKSVLAEKKKPQVVQVPQPVHDGGTEWVMAAIAVYLMESEGLIPTAGAWKPAKQETTDQWINRFAVEDFIG